MRKRYILPTLVLFLFLCSCAAYETEPVDSSEDSAPVREESQPSEEEEPVDLFPLPDLIEEGMESEPADPESSQEASEPAPEPEPTASALTVQMGGSAAGALQREFTGAGQAERVLALLPGESDQPIIVSETSAGAATVQVNLSLEGTDYSYTIFPQNYVVNNSTGLYYTAADGLYDLFTALLGWDTTPSLSGLTYKGETVQSMYSFQFKFRSYHQITNNEHAAQVLNMIAEKQPDEELTYGNVGFLIHAGGERYPIYLDGFADMELTNLSIDMINAYPAHASWLVYMDLNKIQSITFSGLVGQGMSLSGSPAANLQTTITDPQSIRRVGSYLKKIVVEPDPKIYDEQTGIASTGDLFLMDIAFTSGITYRIGGYTNEFSITSTDMTEMITYQCTGNQLAILRDLINLQA